MGFNCRLQEGTDVALPKAICRAVTEEISAFANFKLSETVLTMISRSLEEKRSGLVADHVAIVMAAMPQQPVTVSREQLHSIFQEYLEQRFSQPQGHPVTEQQEVVPQRTVSVQ